MTTAALIPLETRSWIAALTFAAAMVPLLAPGAFATSFEQTNLVSDLPGVAANQDPNLLNPWGMANNAGSPFWISDQGANVATLYNGAGVPQPPGGQPLVVSTPLGPTGMVANPDILGGSFPSLTPQLPQHPFSFSRRFPDKSLGGILGLGIGLAQTVLRPRPRLDSPRPIMRRTRDWPQPNSQPARAHFYTPLIFVTARLIYSTAISPK